ncbi:peptidoglycan-binding protein [Rhizobium calliandrae]|uniref:Peptidoglycan-binding protein n=1 Tax=Rhizobium calliandrae TaxID=1312182 RepID=A0ABT7KMV0_9HYPH|nr:peptidoglycan-binding protein [Rhizobium calliandrae]MDL2409963.1 peptidoglycan-binding protein [Rhizobium calliandrae]
MRSLELTAVVLLFLISSRISFAQSDAEEAANIIMKLCIAAGEESISITTTGSSVNASDQVVADRTSRGIVGGISNEITALAAEQASQARACTRKYLGQVLQILLRPSKFVPNAPPEAFQQDDASVIRECDRYATSPGNRDNPNRMMPIFYQHLNVTDGLRACSSALEREEDNPRIKYQLARIENKLGRYDAARARIDALIKIKYPPAFGERGDNFQFGDGIPVNMSAAIETYKRGVEIGDANSAFALAELYREGKSVKQDFLSARKYAEIAYKQGHPEAAFLLGAMYREGQGVDIDYSKARDLLTDAVAHGAVQGHFSLAALEDEGKGGPRDALAAGRNLFKALQLQSFSSIVDKIVDYQTGPDAWSSESMKSLQKELATVGYYSGAIDGVVGNSTKEAIEKYFNR